MSNDARRHELSRRLKRSSLVGGLISVETRNGTRLCPAYFIDGYGNSIAIHPTPGTVWWKATHIASGMAFPALDDYPEVSVRTAWIPHALMADIALLCAVAQVHFLMTAGVDWGQIDAHDVQNYCRGPIGEWEEFAFRSLEEALDLVADEAVRTLSATNQASAEA